MPRDIIPEQDDPILLRLQEGRQRILDHGLAKKRLVNQTSGAVCARGALMCSQTYATALSAGGWCWGDVHGDEQIEIERTEVYLLQFISSRYGGQIPSWNNADERSREDVIEVFDLAIASRAKELTGEGVYAA